MFARRSRALLSKISPLLPRSAVCCVWGRGLRHHRHRHRRLSAPKSFLCVCWARAPFSLLKEVKCAAKLWLHSPLPLLSLTRMQERSLAHALFSLLSLSLPHTRARARYQRSSTAKARQPPLNLSVCVFSEKRYTAKHRPSFFVCGVRAALRESARHGTHLGCQAARARSAARTLNVSMLCRRFGEEC